MITNKIKSIAIPIVTCSLLIILAFPAIATPVPPALQQKSAIVTLTGTIKKVEVEGGCYQLTTDNGKNYELVGKFPKRDGIKVRLGGEVAGDMVTICQVGQPFKVKSVKILRTK
jgi:hypothetical protein